MKNKKYELMKDKFILYKGKKLYRIRALKKFTVVGYTINKGDIGGYVEGYHNLSQEGGCWISESAKVYGNAIVRDNARVYHRSKVYGNAVVKDEAIVEGNAEVYGNAKVENNASVGDHAKVCGNAVIKDEAIVFDSAKVYGNARILGSVGLGGDTKVYGNSRVKDSVSIYSNFNLIYGNTLLKDCAGIVRYKCRSTCHLSDNVLVEGVICIRSRKSLVGISGNSVIDEYIELKE